MGVRLSVGLLLESPGRLLAAGRFVRRALLAGSVLLVGCFPVQAGSGEDPAQPRPVDPAIERGAVPSGGGATAERLLTDARVALEGGDAETARRLTTEVIDDWGTVPGSSRAFWLRATAEEQLGDPAAAAADADRYVELLPSGDSRRGEAGLLAARNAQDAGQPIAGLRTLLRLEGGDAGAVEREALPLAQALVRRTPTDTLLALSETVPETVFGRLVRLESAVGLYFRGEVARAAQIGRDLLQQSLTPEDRRVAQSLVEGNAETVLGGDAAVGAILPTTGSPVLREYAAAIEEGIRVAFETRAQESRRPVRLEVRDDGGDPARAERSLHELEAAGALGVIGPLLDRQLDAAARSRTTGLALVSPTAERVPEMRGVYSLGSNDPGAARALAEYAAREGYQRVAVVYPRAPIAEADAQAFRAAFQNADGGLAREVREYTYDPGTTFFREQLTAVAEFEAQALVLPVPESDVELIAPQVSFFALDSLGVQILGTGAWASPEVLDRVDSRHLDGVVVASARDPEGESPEYQQFVQRYEQVVRKTLRSPIPAFGYDAASLILEALGRGARTPADLEAQLEGIRDFPGATGRISIQDGQIVRRHQLYEIRDGQLRYLGRTFN